MRNVDPIRYAWECCNAHVPFPAALTRGATSSNVAASLSSVHADPTPAGEIATMDAEAALQSFINGEAPQSLAEKMDEEIEECAEGEAATA
jgi:hypothetical protein